MGDDLIRLNVGGKPLMTYRQTLMLAPSDSLLCRMFHPDSERHWQPRQLPDGAYFLDCDPTHFGLVLNSVRHGNDYGFVNELDSLNLWGVMALSSYLGLTALHDACRMKLLPPGQRESCLLLFSEDAVARWANGLDLFDHSKPDVIIPRPRAKAPLKDMADRVAAALPAPLDQYQFFPCRFRRNKTLRPDKPVKLRATERAFTTTHRDDADAVSHSYVYYERVDHQRPPVDPSLGTVLIFIKVASPVGGSLQLSAAKSLAIDPRATLRTTLPALCQRMGVTEHAVSDLWEEVNSLMVIKLHLDMTFADEELDFGDIIWLAKKGMPDGDSENRCPLGVLSALGKPVFFGA
jgi:hypothetical protein